MLALMVDLATIGSTFFVGLALWRLGTLMERFLAGRDQGARGDPLALARLAVHEGEEE